jgi:hypothetical protein
LGRCPFQPPPPWRPQIAVEIAFDGHFNIEAFIDSMEQVTNKQIPGDLKIQTDAHTAIARFGHAELGAG